MQTMWMKAGRTVFMKEKADCGANNATEEREGYFLRKTEQSQMCVHVITSKYSNTDKIKGKIDNSIPLSQ